MKSEIKPEKSNTKRRGRPPKADAGEDIINASKALFAQYGYKNVSVEEILETAQVSRPTFYKHFSSKEDVAEKIFFDFQQATMNAVLSTAQGSDDTADLWERSIEAYLTAMLAQGKLLPELIDFQTLNEKTKKRQYEMVNDYSQTLSTLLSQTSQITIPAQYIEAFITAVDRFVIGICFQAIDGQTIKKPEEYVKEAKSFLLQLAKVVAANTE